MLSKLLYIFVKLTIQTVQVYISESVSILLKTIITLITFIIRSNMILEVMEKHSKLL